MMRILINYLPVYKGGGLQNAVNFWKSCLKYDTSNEWICLARKDSEISKLSSDDQHKIIEIDISTNYFYRFFIDNKTINKYSIFFKIDVIFTLVGPGPLTKRFPKVNGWHEPGYVYPESIYWKRVNIKDKILQKLKYLYTTIVLRRTDFICVQTETMKKRMIKYRNIPQEKLKIVPNGITSFCEENYLSEENQVKFSLLKNKIKLLVLSEPWLHKNFDYLIEVANLLDHKYIFIISFDTTTNSLSSKFIKKVYKLNLESKFCFIGRVLHSEIKSIYNNADGIFLPTLLESFSANYVEAMYYNKPIFTSNLDFAKEVCKDYAFYFDPLDPKSGYHELINFFERNGKEIFFHKNLNINFQYPNWENRFGLYLEIIKEAKNKHILYG